MKEYFDRLKKRTRYELAWLFTFIIPLGLASNVHNTILDGFIIGFIVAAIIWVLVLLSNFKK